jgi:hypothetical protein
MIAGDQCISHASTQRQVNACDRYLH